MMASSTTNQYIRQILHHSEAPPPVKARFFYTSPLAIDDPLSPLPPSAQTAQTTYAKLPPRPFSEFDNTALDQSWHDLRRKLLQYNEARGEKQKPQAESEPINRQEKGKQASLGVLSSSPSGHRPPSKSDASTRSTRPTVIHEAPAIPPEAETHDTTGTPFIRAPSSRRVDRIPSRPQPQLLDSYQWDDPSDVTQQLSEPHADPEAPSAKIAVGVSRLHHVAMPDLNLEPIYWHPVNDVSPVVRATWFYKDTMLPVEPPVANMLEAGYTELRPWTETWADELNSAVEVGAAGEAKILHKLWPDLFKRLESRPNTARTEMGSITSVNFDDEPATAEKEREHAVEVACDIIDIAAGVDGPDNKASGTSTYSSGGGLLRWYPTAGVIYANAADAYILKPNLQPSAYYGRRPLANYIRKGRKLGIAVVRGFDQAAYDRLYPSKKSATAVKAEEGVSTSQSGAPPNRRKKSDPALAHADRPKVTELILVIHGIGQKLSERMESFHFTHAINAFRREISVELGTDSVKARLRKDMGGIMVLPVNWRQSLSFEDGQRDVPDDPALNDFGLKDITPETLPSVRNIVSDVMLDVPYYLSHHQPKMIAAVIGEANRIYKLWCMNNPGFAQYGRVHIIAHSLGSVMAVDILSKQPTSIPPELADPTTVNLTSSPPLEHFLFNTSGLFLCGSPAGFFLLLKRASLMPRLGKQKPGANSSSIRKPVCGSHGTYGCLPVDNIYNIINPYDPVSYRLNATVDASYASSLKPAWVPTASSGWFSSSGSWFYTSPEGASASRPDQLPRLPSNVELETHNFSREEIAEQRMLLLNDNGQIDFFLKYGGGPLEIQYLTMLGAHSSYWLLKDFVRMIVVECGRGLGRDGTILGMRATKKKTQLTT
ncbi:hypothetical protein E4T39_06549 [Aureobasidium subglaciale]|nr:hypothetical protein E4T39_06549 [Aureobasidium subglaciale]